MTPQLHFLARRPSAPDSALAVRAAGSVVLIALYAALRLPSLTSPLEAALTFAGAIVCTFVFERAAVELALRREYRRRWVSSIRDRVTEVIPPVREWPGEVELAIAEARHGAMLPLIDRGEIVEPMLFTHEFHSAHTPPSGIAVHALVESWHQRDALDAARYATEYVGRHRPEHIERERFGSLFGSF